MTEPLSQEAAVLDAVLRDNDPEARALLTRFSGADLFILHHKLGAMMGMVASEHDNRGPHCCKITLPL
jgi:hypothetical protein